MIWVREGTYTLTSVLDLDKECTSETETVIQAYPDETPTVTCSNPTDENPQRVEHNGAWNVWDSIEIKGCYDGVKVYTGNIKIKNSEIHHNLYQGVLIATSNAQIANVLVDGNEIHHNGYDEGSGDTTCFNSAWNPTPPFDSPKHCHGVYLSNAGCDGIDGVTISNNNIHHHAGRAMNINSDGCVDSFIDDTIITGNQLVANSVNVMLWVDVRGTQITGNDFSLGGWPESDDIENAHLGFAGTSGGTITGNTFSMTIGVNDAYQFVDYGGNGAQASFDFNTWNLPSAGGAWYWNSNYREDFSTQWKNVTGWDVGGTINVN